MANKPKAMLFYGDDWRGGTYSIPAKWRGPYIDLCWCIFDAGGEVPNDPAALAMMARLTPRQFEAAWPTLASKFLVSGDGIRHRKIDALLAAYNEKAAKLQQNGSKGGKKTQKKQRAFQANAQATQSKGLGSAPYRAESPILAGDEKMEDQKPSAPTAADSALSPLSGQGLSADASKALSDACYELGPYIKTGALSTADLRNLRQAVQGVSDGALVLRFGWKVPEHMENALAISGIKVVHAQESAAPALRLVQASGEGQ